MKPRFPAFCLSLILLVFAGQALASTATGWCPSALGMSYASDHQAHKAAHVVSPKCLPGSPDCHDKPEQPGLSGEPGSDCGQACECCPSAVSAGLMSRYTGEYHKPHFLADTRYRYSAVTSRSESLYRPPIAR